MATGPKPPDITVASPDDVLLIICPGCGHRKSITMRLLAAGANYVCDGCELRVRTGMNTTPSWAVIEARRTTGETFKCFAILRNDGLWLFLDEGELSVLQNLDNDSERAIAIVIGSMIETRLQRAIVARFRRNQALESSLFRPSGPLGTFSTKIDLACLMGLLSDEGHRDLKILKDIRNSFAHDLSIRDFSSRAIADKAANFKLIDSYVSEASPGPPGQKDVILDPAAKPCIFVRNAAIRLQQPKDRYLFTAQLITVKLATCDDPQAPWPLL
jgi:hypothetical protein